MIESSFTWLRRHHRAVSLSIVLLVVLAIGYGFVSAVLRVRTSASRLSDL